MKDVPGATGAAVVRRQFVQVGERRVLLRHAGSGPAVVLVHQSPQSSISLLPWFDLLAPRHAVFAPDTPGFGLSDPLALAQPTIPDLAAALGRLLDALGLQRVLLYGVHTGAAIAARLAHDQPQRVAALVCDGLSAFTAAERQPLLDGYLPPFEPSWDGTHLLWLWARMREQTLYFPWHVGTAAARIPYPLATPADIHASAMELLDAGDGYRAGYRSPLLYPHGAACAARLAVPAWLLYRRTDVLRPHLDRLPPLPPQVQAREVADAAALQAAAASAFAACAAQADTVDSDHCAARSPAVSRHITATAVGELAWLLNSQEGQEGRDGRDDRNGASVADASAVTAGPLLHLVLPDIGTPAALPADLPPQAWAIAIELPGHGASAHIGAPDIASGAWLDAVLAALPTLSGNPATRVHLHAVGASAAFAAQLALRLGSRCGGLTWTDPLALDSDESAQLLATLPDLQTRASGAHLIEAWNWARLRHLFKPWLAPTAAAALAVAAPPPRRVHADSVEMLRAGPLLAALWQASLAAPWPALAAALLQHMPQNTPLLLRAGSDLAQHRQAARIAEWFGLQRDTDGPADGGTQWSRRTLPPPT